MKDDTISTTPATTKYIVGVLDHGHVATGFEAILHRFAARRRKALIRELRKYGIERTTRLGAMTLRSMMYDAMEFERVVAVLGRKRIDELLTRSAASVAL